MGAIFQFGWKMLANGRFLYCGRVKYIRYEIIFKYCKNLIVAKDGQLRMILRGYVKSQVSSFAPIFPSWKLGMSSRHQPPRAAAAARSKTGPHGASPGRRT